MVEAVTSRVSVLPVVGSDLLTGLSVGAGATDQLFLGSGDILDKVGHGAGQSGVRMGPVEHLPELHEVCDIMFSWMRPVAVLTSQFFLSDEEGDLEMPLRINGAEPFTIVLGAQIGSGMCYGGSSESAERCGFHDVKSSNSGTIRNVVESDVVGNVEY